MKLRLHSHFIFVFFFLLAVIKPVNVENINRYVGGGLLFILFGLFLYHLFRAKALGELWQRFPLEVLLILLFLGINILAIFLNLVKFDSYFSLLAFAVASLAVWLAGFVIWYLYQNYQLGRGEWLGWSLLLAVGAIALWQVIDYSSSRMVTQYFVSADAISAGAISSITRWHTIYGVIAALGILVAIKKLLNPDAQMLEKIFWVLLIGLLIYTGIMGESRNFIFTLAVGILGYLFRYLVQKPKTVILFTLISIVVGHFLVIQNSRLTHEYGQIFPYIKKIANAQMPDWGDWKPQINNHSLTGRAEVWEKGYQMWQQSPWIGIGPGAYRAANPNDEQQRNLHNYYFQVLVDTGVIGFSILLLLLGLLLRRAYRAKNLVIFVAILGSLIFDNYLDYSLAWVFSMSWFLFITQHSRDI